MTEQCSTCKYAIAMWNYGMFGCKKGCVVNGVNRCDLYGPIPRNVATTTKNSEVEQ